MHAGEEDQSSMVEESMNANQVEGNDRMEQDSVDAIEREMII